MVEGKYSTEIFSAEEVTASESNEWTDLTQQLRIGFRNLETGAKMSHWYNLNSFVRYNDLTDKQKQSGKFESRGEEGYAVDKKSGKRLIVPPSKDPINAPSGTDKCMNILNTLAYNAGLPQGDSFTESDLIGQKVGIVVKNNNRGNARVVGTYMLPEVKEAVAEQEA
jgi:hypothetical protein